MSNLFDGKTRIEVIEQQKIEDRKRYEHLQELKRQQEERDKATREANEKTSFEKILDMQEHTRQMVYSIQSGSPANEGHIIQSLKQMCDILDFLLQSGKTEENEER